MNNTKEQDTINLSGILKKVLYFNEQNNYYIAVLENNQKICGQYFDTDLHKLEDEEIILKGNWETHKKYGVQFAFVHLEIKKDEANFFLTKIVKGISKKIASSINLKYTDEEIYEILDNEPAKLLEFKGISDKKLVQIVSSWNKFKHLRELSDFLGEYGVSKNLINKIYIELAHVENLIEKINTNPYILTNIKGIGFKRADEIASSLGINKKSDFRIQAALNYTLKEYCESNGNSSVSKEKLFELLDDKLNFIDETDLYQNTILSMLNNESLYQTKENRYAPSNLYYAEKNILEFFEKRKNEHINQKIVKNFDEYISKKELTLGFTLSPDQKSAVEIINQGYSTLLLIGYAGTGKSTSSRAILELLEEINSFNDIHCIALSGVAAQRISETTGYNASTIQSLLLSAKEKDYFDYKVILLDEASMVNSITFNQIIRKLSDDCIFIIVGDDGQLPAIGAGDILANAISFDLSPLVKLTKIYRQNEHQAISIIANDIREGKVPHIQDDFEDFKFLDVSIENYYALKTTLSNYELTNIRNDNNYKILNSILNTASKYLETIHKYRQDKKISLYLTTFQVITPMKSGILGVENLNINLQKLLNNNTSKTYQTKLYTYKIADKIIHTKNENMKTQSMYEYKNKSTEYKEKRIFNGMLGMIIKLDFEQKKCIVLYPNDDTIVFYDFVSLDNYISLAYCLTIHKTQGMEYETAIIPMSYTHYIMHNTKLLYTAVTRAKSMCYVIGEKESFEAACKKIDITKRQTVINDLLRTK
jgi:exodeoxyribonuclease V alpha subunit